MTPIPMHPSRSRFEQCSNCDCPSEAIMVAGGCPRAEPVTEPGELAELREPTPPIGAMTKSIFSGIGILLVFWFVWELGQGRWW